MELSAYILAYNETDNVGPLMDSLKGVSDVVVLDNGSLDDTVAKFKARGARVIDGSGIGKHRATEEDRALFRERFGFEPLFEAGEVFDNAGERRNHAASLCRNDWVVNPDCDERPEWDLKKLKAQLNGQPLLRHRYIHKHNPDGTPLLEFVQCKLYNRKHEEFRGRIHEVLVSKETGVPSKDTDYTEHFALHHYQKQRSHRSTHTRQLEFQAMKEENVRNLYYLAREYGDFGEPEKSIKAFGRYFQFAHEDFRQQRAQAWLQMAENHRALKQDDEAVRAYHHAMREDSDRREPFFYLAQYYMDKGEFRRALIYLSACIPIPYNPQGYLNDMRLYTWGVHDKLSVCYQRLGVIDAARMHWLEALKHLPEGEEGDRILLNGRHMVKKAADGGR